jgi:hypothetical protein
MLDNEAPSVVLRTTFEECVGKTVAGFARAGLTGPLLFRFTDGTFLQVSLERGYDPSDAELVDNVAFNRRDYYDEDMVALGMLSAHVLREEKLQREKEEKARAEQREREERAEYLRLQRKYGQFR